LSAKNALGTVNGATQSFSTNNNPPTQGSVPSASTNAAEDVTRISATLNARVNPHASQTTYWFEYGDDTDFGSVSAFQSSGNGDTSTSVSAGVSGLNPLTKYYFRINAQNQFGTVNGATQNFTTKGPAGRDR
jgi:phosphodiesterase/alkaline phosphatase D-like protein